MSTDEPRAGKKAIRAGRERRNLLLVMIALLAIGIVGVWLLSRSHKPKADERPQGTATIMPSKTATPPQGAPCEPACPTTEMVIIPAGSFWMGCDTKQSAECSLNEMPGHRADLPTYEIDRTEVTRAAYQACVRAGICTETPVGCILDDAGAKSGAQAPRECSRDRERLPVDCAHWDQAAAFCAWIGKRLPTEAEWEKAARGDDHRLYPWGNEPPDCGRAVMADSTKTDGCGCRGPWPVCSRPGGNSPFGICDMAGNVMEWVADWYDEKAYAAAASPQSGIYRVVRGGEWSDTWLLANDSAGSDGLNHKPGRSLRVTTRVWQPPLRGRGFGFRCAR